MAARRMLRLIGLQRITPALDRRLDRRDPTPLPALQQATATTSLMKIVLNAVAVWLHFVLWRGGQISSYI